MIQALRWKGPRNGINPRPPGLEKTPCGSLAAGHYLQPPARRSKSPPGVSGARGRDREPLRSERTSSVRVFDDGFESQRVAPSPPTGPRGRRGSGLGCRPARPLQPDAGRGGVRRTRRAARPMLLGVCRRVTGTTTRPRRFLRPRPARGRGARRPTHARGEGGGREAPETLTAQTIGTPVCHLARPFAARAGRRPRAVSNRDAPRGRLTPSQGLQIAAALALRRNMLNPPPLAPRHARLT